MANKAPTSYPMVDRKSLTPGFSHHHPSRPRFTPSAPPRRPVFETEEKHTEQKNERNSHREKNKGINNESKNKPMACHLPLTHGRCLSFFIPTISW